jgi:hypothetical protein
LPGTDTGICISEAKEEYYLGVAHEVAINPYTYQRETQAYGQTEAKEEYYLGVAHEVTINPYVKGCADALKVEYHLWCGCVRARSLA